ncbi:hypothetical protein A3H16_04100 [Candidatus Kaiserbacteria bacterium RIFCSPLOWO2_12_FULL_53_8]|uniref:PRTRC system protein B n=2 Tax=Candidatus Kaiseribacteriota TaxID=1752734 RepID=A0A1F6CTG7_9BACT|nr:MAG: hypothetical protein A2851_05520 [Candidatus Kaiserbacteria bacterium RIFCSPHIGHO2_01_FULL_53_29]OGG92401.1 MAG: hypothetical protein A3H16_04100 [Candidatus Kaiserbacteria bacterium RIFCSPLOWO2_12_FULL_53_8]
MGNRQYLRIEGDAVHLVTERVERTVRLPELLAEAGRQAGFTSPVLPTGCRMFYASGERTAFVIEQPPQVRQLTWRNMDNEGREQWKLAFPYIIFVVACVRDAVDSGICRIFYRNAPLGSGDDKLQRPNLCNTNSNGSICTGSMRVTGATMAAKADSFVSAFWQSNFNSDLHNQNWTPSARKIVQVASLAAWQAASDENPLFPLTAPWLEGPKLCDLLAEIGGAR